VHTPKTIGLRTGKHSYITYPGVWDIYELYDLDNDPDQQNNLLGHIRFGNTYGTFLEVLKKQDPELWKEVKPMDDRITEIYHENKGKRP
jgi:hypothetical protein